MKKYDCNKCIKRITCKSSVKTGCKEYNDGVGWYYRFGRNKNNKGRQKMRLKHIVVTGGVVNDIGLILSNFAISIVSAMSVKEWNRIHSEYRKKILNYFSKNGDNYAVRKV